MQESFFFFQTPLYLNGTGIDMYEFSLSLAKRREKSVIQKKRTPHISLYTFPVLAPIIEGWGEAWGVIILIWRTQKKLLSYLMYWTFEVTNANQLGFRNWKSQYPQKSTIMTCAFSVIILTVAQKFMNNAVQILSQMF